MIGIGPAIGLAIGAGAGVVATPFSPLDIAGLLLDLDAAGTLWQDVPPTTLAVSDGDPVGYWEDASAESNNGEQATGSKQPALYTGSLNSQPIVAFEFDDALKLAEPLDLEDEITIAVVFRFTGGSEYYQILSASDGIGTDFSFELRRASSGDGLHFVTKVGGNVQTVVSDNFDVTEYHVVVVTAKTSTPSVATFYVDGIEAGTGAFSPEGTIATTTKATLVGARASFVPYHMDGDLARLLAYNAVVSGDDLANLHAYLINRYLE